MSLDNWLRESHLEPISPASPADWAGFSEVLYWTHRLVPAKLFDAWVSDEELALAIPLLTVAELADLSLALFLCNRERHNRWLQQHLEVIQRRLSRELGILLVEDSGNLVRMHFLSYWKDLDEEEDETTTRERTSDLLHEKTIERLRLLRRLFPQYEQYGSQGYGHGLGILGLPYDSTAKTGIEKASLPPSWPVRINGFATGLGRNRYRPATWDGYLEEILEVRQLITACFEQLQKGVARFFERDKPLNVIERYIDDQDWGHCTDLVRAPTLLPTVAVDPWGFAQPEGSQAQSLRYGITLPNGLPPIKWT